MSHNGKATVKWIVISCIIIGICAMVGRGIVLDYAASALKHRNYVSAKNALIPLAMLGDGTAQYLLGMQYAFGWGVEYSTDKAMYWFRRAKSNSGSALRDPAASAAYYVGNQYAQGVGVEKNEVKATEWFAIAHKSGFPSPTPSASPPTR